jgi:hypothetical protein
MNGRRLRSVNSLRGSTEISLQGLAKGMYILRIEDESNRVQVIEKIIKQ